MKRMHLFEWEDQTWFPVVFRNLLTDSLRYIGTKWPLFDQALPIIEKGLSKSNSDQVIDLCSGASGPWLGFINTGFSASVKLTDKFPNASAINLVAKESKGQITYSEESIDATDVPENMQGMRTLFMSFHHFKPDMAKAILQDAVDKNTSIAIFECNERNMFNLLFALPLNILLTFLCTPFVKPLTISRLFWTYIIPIFPLVIAWDGWVSNLRTYSPDDLKELVNSIDHENYVWEIGKKSVPVPGGAMTYLLGYPKNKTS
ncbi:MAG: hypothetical protein COA42_24165 [Alteromonadaceae bacterium]|nr:MAG: hypothetical protein COA42_24165 [Alteromonadaceae bacterium]